MTNKNTEKTQKIDFAVGGQAVIEGVMMRSSDFVTVAVRKMDGSVKVHDKGFISIIRRYKLTKIPLLRGVINMFEMIIIGTKALNFSAQEQLEDEEKFEEKINEAKVQGKETPKRIQPDTLIKPSDIVRAEIDKDEKKTKLVKFAETILFAGSIIFALGLSLFLFKFIPFWTTSFLSSKFELIDSNYIIFNLIDGITKLSIFILYIGIISMLPGLKRVFQYHGAEHKSIFTYEKNLPLKVENAKKQSRFHPRCGTSFILIIFIISILVYTVFPKPESFWTGFIERIAILPLIAGLAYEFLKISAKKQDSFFMQIFIKPGLWLQRLTTSEPDDTQLEVALVALQKAIELEKQKQLKGSSSE